MAAYAGDFDDFSDEEFSRPPLPPEDRLWRHPSELGAGNFQLPLDDVAVRRRWLNHQPSRASAWTAGLVGAILATGLVALGTHLASAFTAHGTPGAAAAHGSPTATAPAGQVPHEAGIGANLAASITRVGSSVAMIDVVRDQRDEHCLGLVVRPDGMVVAPASYVRGANTLLVTLADAVPYVARVVASDPASGIAVLHINGATNLPAVQLRSSAALSEQSFALAVTSPGGSDFVLGTLRGLDEVGRVDGSTLTDVLNTDVPAAKAPAGSALIDAGGEVVGIVAGAQDGAAVAVPSWVAGPVVGQLISHHSVEHGSLGVGGRTVLHKGFSPAGVLISHVTPGSAAGIAGLRVGDIITSVDFQPITSIVGLRGHLYGLAAGSEVLIGIERGTSDLFYRAYLQPPPRNARG